jgi:uncharacterized Zn finger protein (UPF0148 family)
VSPNGRYVPCPRCAAPLRRHPNGDAFCPRCNRYASPTPWLGGRKAEQRTPQGVPEYHQGDAKPTQRHRALAALEALRSDEA